MLVYRDTRPAGMPEEYRADVWPLWFVAFAFLHNRHFGALFIPASLSRPFYGCSGSVSE